MATLKMSDLSVGDWILNHRGFPTKVQVITSDGNLLCGEIDAKSEHCTHLWVQDIKPIPITPEILGKNGFVDNGVGQHYLKCGNGITARVGRNPLAHDDCWLVAADEQVDETISTTCVLFDAKHIHQLQHVLRLVGVDKEINL